MDICLNELSLIPSVKDKYESNKLMAEFSKTAINAYQKGIKKIRTDLFTDSIVICPGYSLHDWLMDKEFSQTNKNYRDFLFAMIKPPFVPEKNVDAYLSANYYFEDQENNFLKTPCLGLASAYIIGSLSIGFPNGQVWKKHKLVVSVEKKDTSEYHAVMNVYSPECFLIPEINCFIAETMLKKGGDDYLQKTSIMPNQKEYNITDDHWKDKLKDFWELLKNSPYVESAVSTSFSPRGTRFIRAIEPDGNIGILHLSKDSPYTLRVKTTGRSYPETKRIAEILENTYS
jgi:hypothetical protein